MNENVKQPTQEEMDEFWKEVAKDEENKKLWNEIVELSKRMFSFKCKPTYNFQSVEFEFEGGIDDIPEMFEVYQAVLNELMRIAPEHLQILLFQQEFLIFSIIKPGVKSRCALRLRSLYRCKDGPAGINAPRSTWFSYLLPELFPCAGKSLREMRILLKCYHL